MHINVADLQPSVVWRYMHRMYVRIGGATQTVPGDILRQSVNYPRPHLHEMYPKRVVRATHIARPSELAATSTATPLAPCLSGIMLSKCSDS